MIDRPKSQVKLFSLSGAVQMGSRSAKEAEGSSSKKKKLDDDLEQEEEETIRLKLNGANGTRD